MDPVTFVLAAGLTVVTALVVFGATVPRALRRPETLHRTAIIHSVVAVLFAVPASWLGFPLVVAGGGIALGLRAVHGPHRRVAVGAVALGALVLALGVVGTAFPPGDGD